MCDSFSPIFTSSLRKCEFVSKTVSVITINTATDWANLFSLRYQQIQNRRSPFVLSNRMVKRIVNN